MPPPVIHRGMTLERHILECQRGATGATGEFSILLHEVSLAAKIVNSRVNAAGLADILGLTGERNVQGEEVQRLDAFAHETFVRTFEAGGQLCAMASEEAEEIIPIPEPYPTGKYVLLFDPLDGSSNIDVNGSLGSIFSIHRRVTSGREGGLADCLQPGRGQACAGYVIYGASTMLVYTTGDGVHGFTLDPAVGEFFLSHEDMRMPPRGKTYSVNEGNTATWSDGVRNLVEHWKTPDKPTGRPYGQRYVGTLVADFHRTLLTGGIFMYPADTKYPRGKLRLLYECNPMAFIADRAGGAAIDGERRILDLEPKVLHERCPLFIGSREDVATAERILKAQR